MGVFPAFAVQHGLLATSFHRVYFTDGSLRVENLPYHWKKYSIGVQLNSFLQDNVILKNGISGYTDNFGIQGLGIENETIVKLNSKFTLSPFFRFYIQAGTKYFGPYGSHEVKDMYYTSDYDLSDFKSYKFGMGIKYIPVDFIFRTLLFNSATLRYSYFYRTDELRAHILTVAFDFSHIKSKKQKK